MTERDLVAGLHAAAFDSGGTPYPRLEDANAYLRAEIASRFDLRLRELTDVAMLTGTTLYSPLDQMVSDVLDPAEAEGISSFYQRFEQFGDMPDLPGLLQSTLASTLIGRATDQPYLVRAVIADRETLGPMRAVMAQGDMHFNLGSNLSIGFFTLPGTENTSPVLHVRAQPARARR